MTTYTARQVRSHRDIPRACSCSWRAMGPAKGWKLVTIGDHCVIHGDGCRACSGTGSTTKGTHTRICRACMGLGVRRKS